MVLEMMEQPSGKVVVLPPVSVSPQQETDHRIANSLQLVMALLASQARLVADPDARDALEAAVQRVSAISSVHRQLYRASSGEGVDAADYLKELAPALEAACGRGFGDGRVRVDAEHIVVPLEFASALGILVTELVMNACKHAYGPGVAGNVDVCLYRARNRDFILEVRDYGLRGSSGARQGRGLGSNIIDLMSRRLGHRHGYARSARGTRFILSGSIP